MIDWKVVPIQKWPVEPTKRRQSSRFDTPWRKTTVLLERELRFLSGKSILLQMAVTHEEIRLDGWIRASARPTHPGVLLTFDSKFGPLTYPCDAFTDWQSNVRAIALALEALRKVDRYGVTKRGEQYTGWKALPAAGESSADSSDPVATIAWHSGWLSGRVRRDPKGAYRAAVKGTHPDHGGEPDDFHAVQEAGKRLGVING